MNIWLFVCFVHLCCGVYTVSKLDQKSYHEQLGGVQARLFFAGVGLLGLISIHIYHQHLGNRVRSQAKYSLLLPNSKYRDII